METAGLLSRHLPALASCVAGALLCLRLWRMLPLDGPRGGVRGFTAREESGTVMLDFILTFPFFLMILLIVIQFALMVNARIVVSWAAFAAARSAVVWTDGGMEVAAQRAKAAAAVACTAVSPAVGLFVPEPPLVLLVLHGGEASRLPGSEMLRRSFKVSGKHLYATSATEVEVTSDDLGAVEEGTEGTLGPHDPVTVAVTYQFHLAVPYADGIFSHAFGGWHRGLPVVPISESVTLNNEGKVRTEGQDVRGDCPYLDLNPAHLLHLL